MYRQILNGSGIDILMLQDGVGTRCLGKEKLANADLIEKRKQIKEQDIFNYFYAFNSAVEAARESNPELEMWANLESFESTLAGCQQPDRPEAKIGKPTNVERLKWQFIATKDLFTKHITFDFYHNMNPTTPDSFGLAGTLKDRMALYNDYKRDFLDFLDKEFKQP